MNDEEWESLCDGCAKCCLNKLECEDTGEIVFTSVACDLIDLETCQCSQDKKRTQLISNCVDIKSEMFVQYDWLPSTCAYRLLAEGKDLPTWHPLVSENQESVHDAGVSIRSFAITEGDADQLHDHVIEWLT